MAGLALALALLVGTVAHAAEPKRVSAFLTFWDQAKGIDSIVTNSDLLTDVTPVWYHLGPDGTVRAYTTATGATYEDPSLLTFLRSAGILVIPSVTNVVDGRWDGALVSRIINDPVLANAHVADLVQLAVSKQYDGIDLDYENLRASDRAAFSALVTSLATALHAQGKLLTVNVHAKTSEPGAWDGPMAQDWAALGAAADQVRIMMYDYHWSTSDPGPISPINWVAGVLSFARTVIPAEKISHGVPLYGYDWLGQSGAPVVWREAVSLANRLGVAINWDRSSAAPWFTYADGATQRTVFFEDATSVDAKLQMTTAYGVGGIAFWRLGGEDPGTWTAIRSRFGRATRTGVTPRPSERTR